MREKGTRNQVPIAVSAGDGDMELVGFKIAQDEGCWLKELSQVTIYETTPFRTVGRYCLLSAWFLNKVWRAGSIGWAWLQEAVLGLGSNYALYTQVVWSKEDGAKLHKAGRVW